MTELRVSMHAVDRFIERIGFTGTRAEAHAEIVARISRSLMSGVRLGTRFDIVIAGVRFVVEDGCVVTTLTAKMRKGRRHQMRPVRKRFNPSQVIEVEA